MATHDDDMDVDDDRDSWQQELNGIIRRICQERQATSTPEHERTLAEWRNRMGLTFQLGETRRSRGLPLSKTIRSERDFVFVKNRLNTLLHAVGSSDKVIDCFNSALRFRLLTEPVVDLACL